MNTQRRQGWWSKHWRWAVPVGCVGGVVLVFALRVGLVAVVLNGTKSMWPYEEGVRLASESPAVVEALGRPVEPGWWYTGSTKIVGPSGEADLAIPLSGPLGRGTLYVIANKRAGEWSFELAQVEIEGRKERIDLLGPIDARSSTPGTAGVPTSTALDIGRPNVVP